MRPPETFDVHAGAPPSSCEILMRCTARASLAWQQGRAPRFTALSVLFALDDTSHTQDWACDRATTSTDR